MICSARNMKLASFILISLFSQLLSVYAEEKEYPIEPSIPEITLFESVKNIQEYLQGETEYDYSDRNLSSVTMKYFESHPKKGMAWVYRFTHRTPTRGNDLSIFHYTDGKIIEFHHGP